MIEDETILRANLFSPFMNRNLGINWGQYSYLLVSLVNMIVEERISVCDTADIAIFTQFPQ